MLLSPFTIICKILSIDCFKDAATIGVIVFNGALKSGLGRADGLGGSGFGGVSTSTGFSTFSGSGGFTLECLETTQPLIFKNSVKSTLFFLQQDHPL